MNSAIDTGINIAEICSSLCAAGYSVRFRGFSAIDRYMGLPTLPFLWVETNADIAAAARHIDNLRFPGVEIADGAVDTSIGIYPRGTCYFHCLDRDEQKGSPFSFPLLSFTYDWQTRRFHDPLGVYPLLRKLRDNREDFLAEGQEDTSLRYTASRYRLIMDAALIISRYDFGTEAPPSIKGGTSAGASRYIAACIDALQNSPAGLPPGPETERAFLSCLMVSPWPEKGLELLKRSGFLGELWPELACFDDVDHSKEFHPEGNVWNHTLETFRHRKAGSGRAFDLRLSLGLLLHDAGKPISASFGSRRFDGHAELGARAAAKFLERLEFEPSLIQDIFYLVRNHMLPAALKRLPLAKTAEIMASPLFPTLMELYRCDESSSFKGLDGYYENSAAYQAYLKNARNPYRSADGKKINAKLVMK